ncbi:hypothetical protein CEUSTIGMA_g8691.t1 [Chlamydomonas eustigma]|uniref:Uncharacterized protein n=1 Tax=Chlamydomonas eustigma TaxID=1157962 RepID=A0A250XEB7_9CHLO|nr:hypothetical protein CEUSTIGMA_g8691.t1 [Chlamydomonas eustigma]|eukprot:GAX81259.1 hypothetical protein CEUSTIGMA_g8691.t1 [Chlamydomonas eustigma]
MWQLMSAAISAGYLLREQVAAWRAYLMPSDLTKGHLVLGVVVMKENWPLAESHALYMEFHKHKELSNKGGKRGRREGDVMTEEYLLLVSTVIKRSFFQGLPFMWIKRSFFQGLDQEELLPGPVFHVDQ